MTKQVMFDKAVRGLRSQNWERCAEETVNSEGVVTGSRCVYDDHKGRHCAWGWVDLSLKNEMNLVSTLHQRGIGVAATLDAEQLAFAVAMQDAHDSTAGRPEVVESRFRRLGEQAGLVWPE